MCIISKPQRVTLFLPFSSLLCCWHRYRFSAVKWFISRRVFYVHRSIRCLRQACTWARLACIRRSVRPPPSTEPRLQSCRPRARTRPQTQPIQDNGPWHLLTMHVSLCSSFFHLIYWFKSLFKREHGDRLQVMINMTMAHGTSSLCM